MTALRFEVVDARPERYAAEPTLILRLRVSETTGTPVHAVALKCQIRIEPQRRRYGPEEEERLYELFGDVPRWGDTLRPFLWTHVATTIGSFTGATEFDLPVTCTYDLEVSGAKYFHALDDGAVPLVLLFSGTTFSRRDQGLTVEPVGWDVDTEFRLPVAVWRATMDQYFPNSGWLRLSRHVLDDLSRFKGERGLPAWDQVMEQLLKEAGQR